MSDVSVFNQQIRLLLDAGVPIVVGQALTPRSIRSLIDSVDARMAEINVSPTEQSTPLASQSVNSLELLQKADLDPFYCKAFEKWRNSGGSPESFDCLYELGVAKRKSRWSIADSVFPSLILALVLLPACYFLLFRIYPDIVSLYTLSNVKPSLSMQQLLSLHGPLGRLILWCIPVVVLLAAIVYFWVPNVLVMIFPGFRRYSNSIQQIQNHQNSSADLSSAFTELAWRNRVAHEDNLTVRWFPVLVSTIVCGFVVAFYAILLFWPLAHLLEQISIQSGVVS